MTMTMTKGIARPATAIPTTRQRGHPSGLRTTACAVVVIGAAALLVACGSGDDPDLEISEATGVDPREALRGPEEPEVGDPGMAQQKVDETLAPDTDAAPLQPVDPTLFADAEISGASGSGVSGQLRFRQDEGVMHIDGTLRGLEPGDHALHVHVVGDCSAPDAASAEGHFAPDDDPHGSPREIPAEHHVGDLGNITADETGVAEFEKTDAEMTLGTGGYTIIDRAIVVHAEADDLVSQPAGDAGDRVGCGVVELDVAPAYQPDGEAKASEQQSSA